MFQSEPVIKSPKQSLGDFLFLLRFLLLFLLLLLLFSFFSFFSFLSADHELVHGRCDNVINRMEKCTNSVWFYCYDFVWISCSKMNIKNELNQSIPVKLILPWRIYDMYFWRILKIKSRKESVYLNNIPVLFFQKWKHDVLLENTKGRIW